MKIFNEICELREELRRQRRQEKTVGLVPTMGALHAGHGSLIEAAARENDYVVVSVFVNPTQFGPGEDLEAYPRTFEADCRLAESLGAQAVFAPTAREMYPEGDSTWVEVTGRLTSILCGRSRPTHFRGVTTVVAKLLNIIGPCRAYFGQKDGQQAQVVRRMARDLFMEAEIRIMPIVRESDGLALSSRNAYLSDAERRAAVILSQALKRAETMITVHGCRDRQTILAEIERLIKGEALARLDYAELYTFPELTETEKLAGDIFIALAVKIGLARLIDNIVVTI